jgi:serine-type D-Ala-D-Ala endopeptidase (penicillin-binding protein 7)
MRNCTAMMDRRKAMQLLLASSLAASPSGELWASSKAHKNQPEVRSTAALVLDATNHSVIFARRPDAVLPIASITKLMTALVVLDGKQSLDEVLEVTQDDRAHGKGAASRLAVGTRLSRGELMCLALMSSENRAAHALGRNYPGGEPVFVRAMNARARALGMVHAAFEDPAGLSTGNVASATDLSRLVTAASMSARIREYTTRQSQSVRVGRSMLEFRNTNLLVRNTHWDI